MASLIDFYKQKLAPVAQKLSGIVGIGNFSPINVQPAQQFVAGALKGPTEAISTFGKNTYEALIKQPKLTRQMQTDTQKLIDASNRALQTAKAAREAGRPDLAAQYTRSMIPNIQAESQRFGQTASDLQAKQKALLGSGVRTGLYASSLLNPLASVGAGALGTGIQAAFTPDRSPEQLGQAFGEGFKYGGMPNPAIKGGLVAKAVGGGLVNLAEDMFYAKTVENRNLTPKEVALSLAIPATFETGSQFLKQIKGKPKIDIQTTPDGLMFNKAGKIFDPKNGRFAENTREARLAAKNTKDFIAAGGIPVKAGSRLVEISPNKWVTEQSLQTYASEIETPKLKVEPVAQGGEIVKKLNSENIKSILEDGRPQNGKLSDVIDYPDLFNRYPEAKDIPINIKDVGGAGAYWDRTNKKLVIDPASGGIDGFYENLMHELQHFVQQKEGIAPGGTMEGMSPEALKKYLNIPGEIQARESAKSGKLSFGVAQGGLGDTYKIKTKDYSIDGFLTDYNGEGKIDAQLDGIKVEKQRSGTGTKLVKEFEKWAKSKGAGDVYIESEPQAIGFWEKMGFKRLTYGENGDPSTMVKSLSPPKGGVGDINALKKEADSLLSKPEMSKSELKRYSDIGEAIQADDNVRFFTKQIEEAKKLGDNKYIRETQLILDRNIKKLEELNQSLSPSKGGVTEPKIVKPLKEVYKEKLSSPTDTRIGQEMVSDLPGKTELNKPLVGESTTPTKVTSESSLTPIISKKGKLNIERLAVDDTGKQALQDINEGIPASVISNKSVIEKAKTAKGANRPMSDEQMQNLLAQQLKNRQQVVDLSAKFSKAKAEGASDVELGKIMLELANQSRTAQQGGTFAGRLLQAQNIIADNSASPMQKILALLDNAGVSEEKYLKDAVKVDWNKPTEVVQFYRKYVPPSLGEVLTEVRYTNMLSSPLTHIINTASNALQTGIVTPIEKGTTGLLDAARSALTGKERQYYARAGIDYTKGYLSSLPQAIKKAMDVMSQKDISIRPDMEYLPTGVGGPLQAYTTPLRALEAMDQFFKTLVEGGVTRELGKGPKKLTVTQIAKKASDEANYRIFRQSFDPKGELGQGYVLQLFDRWNSAINGLRRLPGGKWVLPFLQTPTNILKQGVEYSPLGLSTIPGAKNPIEQLSKTLIGTGVFATAYQLASSGLTSWEAPSGEKERELYYAAGLQPYSIKVGDKWVSFSKLGPLSYPIAMAAALADAERKNPDQSKVSNIGKSISGMLGFFGDQSYVRSIGEIVDAIQGGVSVGANAIAGQAANIAGQLVPYKSFLTWLGRITDPTYRKAKTFTERMVKDLPGIGSTLEPYTDVYGNPSKRDLPLVNAISPAKITVEKKSELPLYNKYEQAKIQRGIEKRAGEKLLEGKGSTSGVYQYVNDDGTVKKVDVKKVTSLPESTNYERVKKDQEKWKLADDILNLPAEQQQKAFTDLGISKADAEYYQVAKDSTEAKVAYIKDQVQGVKTYDEFLKKVIPLVREVNGSSILTSGVIDWLYNNRIITADQKKQLKSLEYSNGQVRIKPTSVKKISVPEAKLPASAKTALPKVKRIRTKQYRLTIPK